MKYSAYWSILAVVVGVTALAGILWLSSPDPSSMRDFGLNLFTEMIGVLLTVLVIERILHVARKREERPRLAAMYISVNRFFILHTFVWERAYHSSVPEPRPATLAEFYSRDTFDKIWCYLDLRSQYPLLKRQSWYEELKRHRKFLQTEGRRILALHGAHLDAQVYADIHSLTIDMEIGALEILEGLHRRACEEAVDGAAPANAIAALIRPFPKRYFEKMRRLSDWCALTYTALHAQHKGLEKPFHYRPEQKLEEAKSCALPAEVAVPLLTGIRSYEETKKKLLDRLEALGLK
jgi:hypothetical protein